MSRIWGFVKRELTLCIAFLAAAVSCFFVPPDAAYLGYFDLRTLALLYGLMVVVSGLRGANLFELLARQLCTKAASVRALGLALTALCFFSAMLITNDVAVLTFIPLAFSVLGSRPRELAAVVVFQIVAANLGSMLTPVGNPQNLYLYSFYAMRAGAFFAATGPIFLISGALLFLLCLTLPKTASKGDPAPRPRLGTLPLLVYGALFAVCMLVVFRVFSWPYMLGAVVLTLLIYDRRALLHADFFLLLTFVCFFVFSGNLARIPAVHTLIRGLLTGHELTASALVSQVISNVPAAVLLSGFTDRAAALLLGTNIGGLGTPIASLASLIGIKLYTQQAQAGKKRFWLLFLGVNFGLLAVLLFIGRAFV